MKTRPELTFLRKLLAIGATGLLLHPSTSFATEKKAVDVATTLAHFQEDTAFASVALIRDEISSVTRMTENFIERSGCHYVVSDREEVAQILQIIREAQIQEAGPDYQSFEVRTIVKLTDSSGRIAKLVFERVRYDPINGTLNGTPVQGAAAYHVALRKWATGRKPTRGLSPNFCP